MDGYIKVHRKILEWEWYTDANTSRLFLHCLLMANHKKKQWKGIEIERGSFVTSYANLASELNLSIHQIRVSLNKLKMTGELTHNSFSTYSIIFINNYDDYQSNDKENDNQVTSDTASERQSSDKPVATTKNDKNDKNDKNIRNNKDAYAMIVDLIAEGPLKNAVQEFIEYRKKGKAKLTSHALELIIKKLDGMTSVESEKIEILNQSIMNGWSGIFPLKQNRIAAKIIPEPAAIANQTPPPKHDEEEVDEEKLKALLKSFKEE